LASRNHIPLVNDELYEDLVYEEEYPSFRSLCGDQPLIVIQALSKKYLIPGMRMGWAIIFDK